MHEKAMRPPVLKALICIVDRKLQNALSETLEANHVRVQYRTKAFGTAGSEIINMLGLGGEEKTIAFSLTTDLQANATLWAVTQRLSLDKPGTGIAFTLPLTGISGLITHLYEQDLTKVQERMEAHMEKSANQTLNDAEYALVVSVANQGYSEDIIAAARAEGARGGTVIHARSSGADGLASFMGITVQPEKELVFILAERVHRRAILQAIGRDFGLKTRAQGYVLSIPVDSVAGLLSPEA